jgi:hypothetical protein
LERLRIAALLPHLEVFGGVRRYLLLARTWRSWGHEVVLYTPSGTPPAWLEPAVPVRSFDALADAPPFEVAFTPQPALLGRLRALPADRRVFYCVLEGERGEDEALRDPAITLMANSSALRVHLARRAGRAVLDGIGRIDPDVFHPDPAVRVARRVLRLRPPLAAQKGHGPDRARGRARCAAVPELELVLFDHVGEGQRRPIRARGSARGANVRWMLNPSQDELAQLYASADVFCAAERKAGWCNTAIEAMSAGANALVCTPRSGTRLRAPRGPRGWSGSGTRGSSPAGDRESARRRRAPRGGCRPRSAAVLPPRLADARGGDLVQLGLERGVPFVPGDKNG